MFLKGELQHLEALVTDIREDGKVVVLPKIDGFEDPIDCDPDELRKFFEVRRESRCLGALAMWLGRV